MLRLFAPILCLLVAVCTAGNIVPGPNDGDIWCPAVKGFLSAAHEQQIATVFCSSYLHISPVTSTKTVTTVRSITDTAVATVTKTSVAISSITATVTATAVSSIEVDVTAISTLQATSVISTSTVYTTTSTSTVLVSSVGTTTTTTVTSTQTETVSLDECVAPTAAKRGLGPWTPPRPKPQCFSGYKDSSIISRACSCLSLATPTSTKTVSVSAIHTAVSSVTTTYVQAVQSTVTITVTATRQLSETFTSVQSLDTTLVNPVVVTVFMASTTTTTSTATLTATQTQQASTTATSYAGNFALLDTTSHNYALPKTYSGSSGAEGLYFSGVNLDSAASFTFAGTKLQHSGQAVYAYQAASGIFFPVVDTPFAGAGFSMDCTLVQGAASGGCPLKCDVPPGFAGFPYAGGNVLISSTPAGAFSGNQFNNGPLWGLKGTTDQFTVLAVGMTT